MSFVAPPRPPSPYSSSPLVTSTSTSASDTYSDSPSPATTFSRWKSALKFGKPSQSAGKGVEGRSPNGGSAFAYAGQLRDSPESSTPSSSLLVRTAPERLQTDANFLIQPTEVTQDKEDETEGGRRTTNSASSGRGQHGLPPASSLQPDAKVSPQSGPPSDEQTRPYSVATDTDRSSHSSSWRQPPASSPSTSVSPNTHVHASSFTSLHTNHSGAATNTPLRSPGLGLSGIKGRFFSSPSTAGPAVEPSPRAGGTKSEKYKGLSEADGSSSSASRKKSVGSSSVSSNPASSPRTPVKTKRDPLSSSSSRNVTAPNATPSRGSAATRFLRRVVSAPNTKALLPSNVSDDAPEVPPLPTRDQIPSPVVFVNHSEIDLTASPPYEAVTAPMTSLPEPFIPSSMSASTNSLPYRTPNGSPLNPSGVSATSTRPARSLTVSAASKPQDTRAILGVSLSPGHEPHHKQVFRRTYSSNSIKTRSVSLERLLCVDNLLINVGTGRGVAFVFPKDKASWKGRRW